MIGKLPNIGLSRGMEDNLRSSHVPAPLQQLVAPSVPAPGTPRCNRMSGSPTKRLQSDADWRTRPPSAACATSTASPPQALRPSRYPLRTRLRARDRGDGDKVLHASATGPGCTKHGPVALISHALLGVASAARCISATIGEPQIPLGIVTSNLDMGRCVSRSIGLPHLPIGADHLIAVGVGGAWVNCPGFSGDSVG